VPAQVLIVDDEISLRELVKRILTAEGISAIACSSGHACLDALCGGFRGVILMDVRMPGFSGWETIPAIVDKDLLAGNVIIMLTALEPEDPALDHLKQYVLDYITKPFDPQELIAVVRTYLAYL